MSEDSPRGRLLQLAPLAVTIALQAAIVGELVLAVRSIGHTDHTLSAVAAYQGSADEPGESSSSSTRCTESSAAPTPGCRR